MTTQMLATLFDFPGEDWRLLSFWSDVSTNSEMVGAEGDVVERERILRECLQYFMRLWQERAAAPPKLDFISLLAHGSETRNLINNSLELLGNTCC